MKKLDLDTPCLVIDLDILEENLEKMQARAAAAGKDLRPHAKTHKCSTLAKKQIETGAAGVCVAKISEAEVLIAAGVRGVLITGAPAADQKTARLVSLVEKSPDLMIAVDHPHNIDLLEKHLEKANLRMDVLLDLDVGSRRTGIQMDRAPALARRILQSERLKLRGIQAYAGHVQHIHGFDERKKASTACIEQAAEVFRQLKSEAPSCDIFSASGTGSSDIDLALPDQTELQVGSYALMDTEYGAIESAEDPALSALFRPALTLLATVVNVSHQTHVTIDAGLKSLYRDGGRPLIATPEYALLRYDWFGDEYGRLSLETDSSALPGLGAVLELVASHCDPTVNQFDRFYIVRGGGVVDEWPIDLRGKSQ
jgi:D-serine deaminase-like pyridoxal phosphate-dependent protein